MAHVLIIEDDADLCEIYRMALAAAGHQAAGFFTEPERACRSRTGPVDVVVLDERLEGASGLAWLPRLREVYPEAKVILVSVDPDALERAVELGADAVKLKPFPIGDLLEELQAIVPRR